MKFDFAIGNPAYQAAVEESSDNKTYSAPVYNHFLDEAVKVADKVEMIHPARFLFNAGSTPKAWNEKMLNDPHFKVLLYEEDASKVFSNTDIKGGIAITYHDRTQRFTPIGTFTKFPVLNAILQKVEASQGFESLKTIAYSSYSYHFTSKLHDDFPNAAAALSKGHLYDIKSNVFSNIPFVFNDVKPVDEQSYLLIIGREGSARQSKYIRADYIATIENTYKHKLFMPAANSAGKYGEQLAPSIVAAPETCTTETFLSVGCFDTEAEVKSLEAYTKTKFFRALLGVLKTTQHLTPSSFTYVPIQDFTHSSDINWSASIRNIDRQLYKKYNLTEEEIDFIESHVKEME